MFDWFWSWLYKPKKPSLKEARARLGQSVASFNSDGNLMCPNCGGSQWIKGPEGGMCTNIRCGNPDCRHWYNFAPLVNHMEFLRVGEPIEFCVDGRHGTT